MLKRENTLEMAINTVNTFDEKINGKDALLLVNNYRTLISMFINSLDKQYIMNKVQPHYRIDEESKDIINNHVKFYEELLSKYVVEYNELLVKGDLKEARNILSVIKELQYILENLLDLKFI